MKLNCITVDDEPLALGLITSFVQQTPFLELRGSFGNAVDALKALHEDNIQVVFLDIQMPGLNGMELARVLQSQADKQTRIIFTTAYNQFAIEGYKVDALDYLLKPFNYEEFLRAATKALNYFERTGEHNTISAPNNQYLFVKSDYKLVRVNLDDILYIESLKDYIKIHLTTATTPITALSSLKAIEEKLPPSRFIRLHRSFIVAIDKIDSISKNAVHIASLDITVGDQYKDAFKELLSNWG
ncbi:response regulator transcription factor [Pedobacter sp. BS3]|uniref:LytR/AlgR family response regulator transcription factor n=1 Tax=Pedobacter sp. BS3 TaxID=2567937 RepID=UPI0011EDD977|nr:LytTR family DNA-binding domain-containing protein [Pedobacter sp. BS3]TZF84713.1 response regulator transcription factor [Pedobacter sp. BS3]